jgi:hypothetical protein
LCFWVFWVFGFWGFGVFGFLGFWGFGFLGYWGIGVLGYWGIGVFSLKAERAASVEAALSVNTFHFTFSSNVLR